jgi:serine kinase of HPr protein (carbohydrate metabolism regulator)
LPGFVHGTCVTFETGGVLLRGPSGSGKSDLAFRLIGLGSVLVADDQVALTAADGRVVAAAPENLSALLELRGLGLAVMPVAPTARLALVVDLVPRDAVPRLPEPRHATFEDLDLPLLALHAFDLTAAEKVRLALETIGARGFPGDDGTLGGAAR